ncbi:MAG: hypothetical protein UZ21_OP11001001179 [Microgenomates bacterium OLB22]|nr:MAG: hypothetical protein UZ21_OP11001001179 [Microgenomates bacterium OLB22]
MTPVQQIANLFLTSVLNVYGPYRVSDDCVGYDVDLQEYVASVHVSPNQRRCVVIRIEGFISKTDALDWLNTIMVEDGSVYQDRRTDKWVATMYFAGMTPELLLELYPKSNPLFTRDRKS